MALRFEEEIDMKLAATMQQLTPDERLAIVVRDGPGADFLIEASERYPKAAERVERLYEQGWSREVARNNPWKQPVLMLKTSFRNLRRKLLRDF